MVSVVELHVGQRCDELFGRRGAFLRSSKHNSRIEGICLMVK